MERHYPITDRSAGYGDLRAMGQFLGGLFYSIYGRDPKKRLRSESGIFEPEGDNRYEHSGGVLCGKQSY